MKKQRGSGGLLIVFGLALVSLIFAYVSWANGSLTASGANNHHENKVSTPTASTHVMPKVKAAVTHATASVVQAVNESAPMQTAVTTNSNTATPVNDNHAALIAQEQTYQAQQMRIKRQNIQTAVTQAQQQQAQNRYNQPQNYNQPMPSQQQNYNQAVPVQQQDYNQAMPVQQQQYYNQTPTYQQQNYSQPAPSYQQDYNPTYQQQNYQR